MPIASGTYYVYTVRPGDSLYAIANRFGISVADLVKINAIYPPFQEPDLIYVGQVLLTRTPGMFQFSALHYNIAPGDSLSAIAERFSTNVDLLQGINPAITNPNLIYVDDNLLTPAFVYEIEQGDTLSSIARRFQISLSALMKANEGRIAASLDLIVPGFHLIVPLQTTNNSVVFLPLPSTTISTDLAIIGYARAFEGAMLYQIRDANDQVITAEKPIQASAGGPAFGHFIEPIVFDRSPTTSTGQLWVYNRSARDGSIQDLIEIDVFF